ncbi:type 1 fimbrial protein [Pseudomonas sp. NPDC089530]|uniref:type 1 fimbrial protein n=1 Tax=Pseudomonas sp. NPDC089530 TaxID=3390651 RepID=UPI003CFFD374
MNTRLVMASIGVFLGLSGVCSAAPQTAQGVIYFHGSIEEEPCTPSMVPDVSGSSLTFNLSQCPTLSRGNDIRVSAVGPSRTVTALDRSAVDVKLVADSGQAGRYYDQQYVLVDKAGKPVNSGTYLITLTSP